MENEMKENTDVFDKVEAIEKAEEQKVVEEPKRDLAAERAAILEDGDLDDLKELDEEIEEEESELKAPSLDDLDEVPQSAKFKIVDHDTKWDKNTVMTIERVRLQPPFTKDRDGNVIEPEQSGNGNYYKAKIVLEFVEEFNGSKLKQTVPGLYYGVEEDGTIRKVPGIAAACSDDKLEDPLTPAAAKVRNLYCKFVGKNHKDVSNKEFAQGMVGKKVKMKLVTGEHKKRKYGVLRITEFVK